jgi:hypothetical protein
VIATFIYTECQAPGPFKTEPGFKVKDLKVWKSQSNKIYHESVRDENRFELEQLVMEAVGSLPNFEPPSMSPFITTTDFLALEKQWLYYLLPSGRYLFARMSTSGLTHGRRGNPFHMGIIFDKDDLSPILEFWRKSSSQEQIFSPADLYTWSGWQDPRTSEDVEEATLSEGSFPMPALLPKARVIDDFSYLSEHRAEIRTALVAIEKSYVNRSQANFGSDDSWNFLKQASIATTLLPPNLSWVTALSSTQEIRQFEGKSGWARGLIHGQTELVGPMKGISWAGLAMELLEKKQFQKIESLLYKLGRGAVWQSTSGSSALWFLPIAILLESVTQPDLFSPEQVTSAAQVALAHWPQTEVIFITQKFKDSVVGRLQNLTQIPQETQGSLVAKASQIRAAN